MYSKKLFIILLLFFAIFFSVTAVSALDFDQDEDLSVGDVNYISSENNLNQTLVVTDQNDLNEDNTNCEIYVGKNITEDGGNGSYENPYATLDLAHDSIKEYKDEITVNIFEGSYNLGSNLIFNTSNLKIQAVENNVIIKNSFDTKTATQSFSVESTSANFTMSGITFDASSWTNSNGVKCWFTPFHDAYSNMGNENIITFENCTFTRYIKSFILDYTGSSAINRNKYIFNSCKFINYTSTKSIANANNWLVSFNFCVFTGIHSVTGLGLNSAESVSFNNIWWGQNNITESYFYNPTNNQPRYPTANYIFNRYAVFDVSENYLGNNQYEIIGKLMWNDTTDEDIDKLGPMTVTLSSSTGDLPETAILQDGTFRVIYNSSALTHDVTAKLDNEIITLNFNTTDIAVETSDIIIGQDQNITVTLPQDFNGTLSIKVNNKTYNTIVDNTNSVTYKIPDVLPAGKHEINVIFADEKNHIYGFNSTDITVSKIPDYDFNATITPTVYLGDNATVTLSLPSGATGNVTVKVGDNEAKTFSSDDIISIDGFVAGNNVVNITFISDIYDSKSVVKNVVASAKPTTLTTVDVTTTYNVAKDLVITLTDVNGKVLANKTINIVVGTINKDLTTNASGQVGIDISSLTPNTYTANIAFAGDEIYNKSSTTAKVTVKEEIKTNITLPEIVAGKATTTTITLPQNATGNVTVIVDGNVTSVVNLTNGSATVTIPELPAGKHNVTISYSGDDNYAGFAQTSAVEVKEPAKPTPKPDDKKPATVKKTATKITAKKKTFKAKTKVKKYTITLKAGKKAVKKVQVILKIGKKTYKAKTNAKGKATFKIKKLTKKGKYTAKITFKGNKLYKATTKKVKITVKK